jgi:hypothetical protein
MKAVNRIRSMVPLGQCIGAMMISMVVTARPANSVQPDTLKAAQDMSLIGCWICQSGEESSRLEFRADGIMLSDGEPSRYTLTERVIRVESDFGPIDCPYQMSGSTLFIVFPGDFRLPCSRTKCATGEGSVADREKEPAEPDVGQSRQETRGSGNEGLLRGTFCHWSGSSSSYSGSSYSHTIRVAFDGQGHFVTGSETSFGNSSGLGYGQGEGASGTYRVVGREVYLNFSDGSQGVATVHNSAADGTITELMYNGDLYAPQLCE